VNPTLLHQSAFSRVESRSLYQDLLVLVSAKGILASAETSKHSTLRFYITSTTKNDLIKLALLPGTQAPLCLSVPPKSSIDPIYELDPELELTLRRLRKARKIVVNNSSSSDSVINSNQLSTYISASSSNIFVEPGQMENNDRTLKELATPDEVYQPCCIQYPQQERTPTNI
ncbi:hypothetical protein CR513_25423, partial [Mucuna pruriens]